jgi:hypothetical protein
MEDDEFFYEEDDHESDVSPVRSRPHERRKSTVQSERRSSTFQPERRSSIIQAPERRQSTIQMERRSSVFKASTSGSSNPFVQRAIDLKKDLDDALHRLHSAEESELAAKTRLAEIENLKYETSSENVGNLRQTISEQKAELKLNEQRLLDMAAETKLAKAQAKESEAEAEKAHRHAAESAQIMAEAKTEAELLRQMEASRGRVRARVQKGFNREPTKHGNGSFQNEGFL